MPTETAATEPVSAFERPKRSSARLRGDVRAADRRAARAAVGLEDVAVEVDGPLAERVEVGHRANRASDQALDLDRPAALPSLARLALDALAGRRRQERVLGGHPAAPGVAQPARHALLDRRRAEHLRLALRPEHGAVRLLEEVELDLERAKLVRPPPLPHAARLELARARRARPCRSAAAGSARPSRRNDVGSPVVRKRYAPSRAGVVLDALARERLGHLARGLLRREDERDVAAEDALQDRADQRVVRAAEDDRVDAGRLQRLRVLAHGLDGSRAVRDRRSRSAARARDTRPGTTSTPASSVRTSEA